MLVRFIPERLNEYKESRGRPPEEGCPPERAQGIQTSAIDDRVRSKVLKVLSLSVPYRHETLLDMVNDDPMLPDITVQDIKDLIAQLIEEGLIYDLDTAISDTMIGTHIGEGVRNIAYKSEYGRPPEPGGDSG